MIPPGFSIDPPASRTTSASTMPTTLDVVAAPEIVLDDDALALKKLVASTASSAPLVPQPMAAYATFRGLYVVQSATEARHVRYAMEIASPELQLHLRITQRFSGFFVLRKRLLRSLRMCQDELARPTLAEPGFLEFDLRHTLLQPCCQGCAGVRRALKRVPFPKRSVVFTTVDDVDARAPLLEAFLDACVRAVVDWKGCPRGRKFACVVLGKFLSFHLLLHVLQQLRLTVCESVNGERAGARRRVPVEEEEEEEETKTQDKHETLAAASNQVEAV